MTLGLNIAARIALLKPSSEAWVRNYRQALEEFELTADRSEREGVLEIRGDQVLDHTLKELEREIC